MNSQLKNFLLFIAVLVLSYLTAPYFGILDDKFYPQQGVSFVGIGRASAILFAGLLLAYMFFIPFIFQLFGYGNKKKIILWLLVPLVLFYLYDSIKLSYIPIAMSLIGFGLAILINKVFKPKV